MAFQVTPLAQSIQTRDFQVYIPPGSQDPFEVMGLGGFLTGGHAAVAMRRRIGVTYIAIEEDTQLVAAYITLALSHLEIPGLRASEEHAFVHVPGVKIAMLARDKRFGGTEVGSELVQVVGLGLGMQLARFGLCRVVWAEAIPGSLAFYEDLGFESLRDAEPGKPTPVYFDLHPILGDLPLGILVERDLSHFGA